MHCVRKINKATKQEYAKLTKKFIDTHKEHYLIEGTGEMRRTSNYLGNTIVLETKSMLKNEKTF